MHLIFPELLKFSSGHCTEMLLHFTNEMMSHIGKVPSTEMGYKQTAGIIESQDKILQKRQLYNRCVLHPVEERVNYHSE